MVRERLEGEDHCHPHFKVDAGGVRFESYTYLLPQPTLSLIGWVQPPIQTTIACRYTHPMPKQRRTKYQKSQWPRALATFNYSWGLSNFIRLFYLSLGMFGWLCWCDKNSTHPNSRAWTCTCTWTRRKCPKKSTTTISPIKSCSYHSMVSRAATICVS